MKRLWVLDTNVVVSGLLTPDGVCAALFGHLRAGRFEIAWTPAITREYNEVLRRSKFGLGAPLVANFLSQLSMGAIVSPKPVPQLPDRDDEPFLAAALATPDCVLVTGNIKDYPPPLCAGAKVITVREALKLLDEHG